MPRRIEGCERHRFILLAAQTNLRRTGPPMHAPIVTSAGYVLAAPAPARLADEVSPGGLWLGGSWAPYRQAFDTIIDCTHFADGPTFPPDLYRLVARTVRAFGAGSVLVRCEMGLNRSALVAGLAIVQITQRPGVEVIAGMRAARSPHVLCNPVYEWRVASCG